MDSGDGFKIPTSACPQPRTSLQRKSSACPTVMASPRGLGRQAPAPRSSPLWPSRLTSGAILHPLQDSFTQLSLMH